MELGHGMNEEYLGCVLCFTSHANIIKEKFLTLSGSLATALTVETASCRNVGYGAYNKSLWFGPSPNPLHSGSFRAPAALY